jgi:hypothetical protein
MIDLPGAGLEGVMKRKKQTPRRRKYAARRKRVLSKRYYDGPSSWLIPMMEETCALPRPVGADMRMAPNAQFQGRVAQPESHVDVVGVAGSIPATPTI